MEVVPKKFKYKQKKDNRGSTIKGVYTLVWACLRGRCVYMYMLVVCVFASVPLFLEIAIKILF